MSGERHEDLLERRLREVERQQTLIIHGQRVTNHLLDCLLNELRPRTFPQTVAISVQRVYFRR